MPKLRNESYNENKGEWFPSHDNENPNTRSRAMYFFHNSLGEVTPKPNSEELAPEVEFADEIKIGDSGSGSSWIGPEKDIISWPIEVIDDGSSDVSDIGKPIETYRNNPEGEASSCYSYRINSSIPDGQSTRLPFRFRLVVWKPNNDTAADLAIYNRYLNALKFMFSSDNTSLKITKIDDLGGDNYEPSKELVGVLPMADVLNFPSVDDIVQAGGSFPRDFPADLAIDERGDGNANVDTFVFVARELQLQDGLMRLPAVNQRVDWEAGNSVGTIDWNATGSLTVDITTIDGFFMIDNDADLEYQLGDYLLLEAADEENEFHNRVVFVNSPPRTTSTGAIAYEIQLLDDIGFFNEDPEEFTITKLTNAPKLRIKYRIPDLGSVDDTTAINIVDDQEDVN